MLVDTSSAADVLYYEAFERLKLDQTILTPSKHELIGFSGNEAWADGVANLSLSIRDKSRYVELQADFVVVNCPSIINGIVGKATLNWLGDIVSTYHQMMKFSTRDRVIIVSES